MASARDLRLLAYFVQIARSGSIRGAAAKLSLSPAVLSEALSELEANLELTLIRRTTRSMTLTEAGAELLNHASAMASAADEAMAIGRQSAGRVSGQVRLTLPIELTLAWLQPIMRRFQEKFADVRVVVHADDAVVPLAASQYDMAVRMTFREKPQDGHDVCCCLPLELVCRPDLLTEQDEPIAERLKRIGFIGSANAGSEQRTIKLFKPQSGRRGPRLVQELHAQCRFAVNNQVVAHQLAREGFGAALLIGLTVADDLKRGRLVRVDERYSFGFVVTRVVARDRYPTPAVRAFRDHILHDSGDITAVAGA